MDEKGIIKDLAQNLISLIGFEAEVEVSENKQEGTFLVDIKMQEKAGLIIGRHGRTLNSIQFILSLMFRSLGKNDKRILLDVSGFRDKEKEKLRELALRTAERAIQLGEPQYLYNLTPYQRRVIHLALAEKEEVVSYSQGEGKERYLVVSPKAKP